MRIDAESAAIVCFMTRSFAMIDWVILQPHSNPAEKHLRLGCHTDPRYLRLNLQGVI